MKVNDYIAEFLCAQNITHIFEMTGGMITNILDAIHLAGKINIVSVHHEQTAAFAVDAYARCTGKPGVAMATSGPGATNLITGIASCYFDSSPALFITGQVNTFEQRGERKIRQGGFQETDIVTIARSITKQCFALEKAEQVEATFNEAYQIAISDRPGPVLIDIPMNLQRAEINVAPIQAIQAKKTAPLNSNCLTSLYEAISQAKRPLILAGGGINSARVAKELLQFAELIKVPIVTSLLAIDTIDYKHPLRVGFIGSYGNRWANLAIGAADLLIVLGSRLDIRQTGADVRGFRANKTIFHVDCDPYEINNRIENCIAVVADLKEFFSAAITHYQKQTFSYKENWQQEINALKNKWPDTNELNDIKGINPNKLMHQLSTYTTDAQGYIVDVGNHQMWAAQSLELKPGQFFITSGGMGAMGFALPAAIGASLAHNKKPVVVIVGDGSLQLNIQELQTLIRNQLPIKIVVLNNNTLGMIRQFQDSYFDGRYQSTYWGYSAPDFAAIANAYGIPGKTISSVQDVQSSLAWLKECNHGPALLQVMIDPHANAYPKIAFGKPITEMEPFATPNAMEST